MTMRTFRLRVTALWTMVALAAVAAGATTISHDPVTLAMRGQPLTLKAKIATEGEPESVTLMYSLFRDAAPFRVEMKSTGVGTYVGTIDAAMLGSAQSVTYYIEVIDKDGAITETPWYDVSFRAPSAAPATPVSPAPAPVATETPVVLPSPSPAGPIAPSPAPMAATDSPESASWKKPALIAGGAALVLGGAVALSDSGGGGGGGGAGDGDGDGGAFPTNAPGTYVGTVTTCETPDGGVTSCESNPMQIVIDSNGVVFSETLRAGQQLTGQLEGNQFTLVATVSAGSTNGTIAYEGTFVNNRVLGTVVGSATDPLGGIVYSGSFSANRE